MKEIGPQEIATLKGMTAENNHTGARVFLASLLENEKVLVSWLAIEQLQEFHGYLTPGVKGAWDEMNAILLANLRNEFTATSFLQINGAL